MPKEKYVEKNFTGNTHTIILQADAIIKEYAADGLVLTLRQLYYQFVSRDLIANTVKEYKRLGKIVSDARLAGMLDWNAIEDRARNLRMNYHNTDPGEAVQDALNQFMLNRWNDQSYYPEVWIEKEALEGVISGICKELDVPFFACKGYTSQSEMWRAANRMRYHRDRGQTPVIIHLGDHDPSGIDMTRDIDERHELFMGGVEVRRIALNRDQISQYSPPPNPAKMTDTRAKGYVKRFGNSSWELDALEPRVMRKLIQDEIDSLIDRDAWDSTVELEEEYKHVMRKIVDNWEDLT